jgi:hypothetical protein
MIVLTSRRDPGSSIRHINVHAHIAGDLWSSWRYDPDGARLTLIDETGVPRGHVPADMFTKRELVALRHAEAVLHRPSPLMLASLIETLEGLVPMTWAGGAPVEAKAVAAAIRRLAVLS